MYINYVNKLTQVGVINTTSCSCYIACIIHCCRSHMFTIWAYLYSQVSNGDIKNLTFTYRSKSSSLVHPTSSFTAAVQDVSDGLVGTLPRTIARSHCRSILPKEMPARTHNDNITNFFISFSHPFFNLLFFQI